MASWFTSTSVNIAEQVNKATSETLPTGEQDLALNLEICDLIRSKTVPAKDAMRALKKRIVSKNPNVQILALQLTDVCIKNGGIQFLIEIASREFVDTLALIIRQTDTNPDVKKLALENVQNWKNAFHGQIQLGYMETTYNTLKNEGFDFPYDTKKLNSSYIDTNAPPEWVDSDTCMISGTPFTFVNRKHHCRNCGGVFVQKYCSKSIALPHFGINIPVRVCDTCYDKITSGTSQLKSSVSANPSRPTGSALIEDEMDEDLKRALELSLAESKTNSVTFAAPAQPHISNQGTSTGNDDEDDEDEAFKAAIAASLREMESGSNKPSEETPSTHAVQSIDGLNGELSQAEIETIRAYTKKIETTSDTNAVPDFGKFYSEQRPKLLKSIQTSSAKYERALDINAKLQAVKRLYDSRLEERLSSAYGKQSLGPTSQSHHPYPSQSYSPYPTSYSPQQALESQRSGNGNLSTPSNATGTYPELQSMVSVPSYPPSTHHAIPVYNSEPNLASNISYAQPSAPVSGSITSHPSANGYPSSTYPSAVGEYSYPSLSTPSAPIAPQYASTHDEPSAPVYGQYNSSTSQSPTTSHSTAVITPSKPKEEPMLIEL